jgi:acetyl-CoA carboxylase carboxyl transferase beta subunit
MSSRIDVSVEQRGSGGGPSADKPGGKRHPNTCPSCGSHYRDDELVATHKVCPQCGHHFPLRARERVAQIADGGSFSEVDADLRSADPLSFFDLRAYSERIAEAETQTDLGDAIISGRARIERRECHLAVMDFAFMGGSMGGVVGEKFWRACELAADRQVPLVCVTASGGARMQEGILSLMQMPKTVCAVDLLREARCAFIPVMTHPTTAGVLASFASLGDVTISEPGALLAFTGPRVVQQTIKGEQLPDDFGLAESNYRLGHLDAIVERSNLRAYVGRLLVLFGADEPSAVAGQDAT